MSDEVLTWGVSSEGKAKSGMMGILFSKIRGVGLFDYLFIRIVLL